MVGFAEPDAAHTGAAATAEDHETPGPDTEQVVPCPFTPFADHVRATACPALTRLGVAVIVSTVLAFVHHVPATVTSGQYATAVVGVSTFIAYTPAVVRVLFTVVPLPKLPPSEEVHVYGAPAPLLGVTRYETLSPG